MMACCFGSKKKKPDRAVATDFTPKQTPSELSIQSKRLSPLESKLSEIRDLIPLCGAILLVKQTGEIRYVNIISVIVKSLMFHSLGPSKAINSLIKNS